MSLETVKSYLNVWGLGERVKTFEESSATGGGWMGWPRLLLEQSLHASPKQSPCVLTAAVCCFWLRVMPKLIMHAF